MLFTVINQPLLYFVGKHQNIILHSEPGKLCQYAFREDPAGGVPIPSAWG